MFIPLEILLNKIFSLKRFLKKETKENISRIVKALINQENIIANVWIKDTEKFISKSLDFRLLHLFKKKYLLLYVLTSSRLLSFHINSRGEICSTQIPLNSIKNVDIKKEKDFIIYIISTIPKVYTLMDKGNKECIKEFFQKVLITIKENKKVKKKENYV